MITQIRNALTVVVLLLISTTDYAQAPPLGSAAGFVLFSSVGAVTNTGISQITGNVGTNSGSSTGFGNVNGGMHDNDGVSAQCSADLLTAYNHLNSTVPNFFPAPLLGNGQILNAGVYLINSAATLNLDLILNAQGDAGAVFIFQIQGTFSTGANSKIKLKNGAQSCNIFWKVEGLVSMASGTTMRGTVIANNAAINMNTGDTLEGRALSTAGAVTLDGILAYTPVGCGSPILSGPIAPALASTECYALFSTNGAVANSGITHVRGDVGTNVGLTTGFDPLLVTGTIHPIPDASTEQCAADLLIVYNYLNTLPVDIDLLYPAQFGNSLTLTPHTYLLDAATELNDTLYLNALGNSDAVFVIKINGALSANSYSKVKLINGAKAKNVFWKIEGAVNINSYAVFVGTIVCNNGAMGALATGAILNGRALTTTGALSAASVNVTMPTTCCVIPAFV
ncbi:MAG: ice-binding family protein, partial [Bacteroidetes bacterium]|nr:ice-binding family protein [Bacteroidota bacterium]